MRKHRGYAVSQEYKIMVVDDEEGIVDVVVAMLRRAGYWCCGFTDSLQALEELEKEHYDLLILDYFMQPLQGDKVVERIRQSNYELYILLLTGHKELAPPVNTLKSLAIQGYCEKGDRTDQLELLVESGIKSIEQMRTIKRFQEGLNSILGAVPKIYQLQPIGNILEEILRQILPLVHGQDAFILVDEFPYEDESFRRADKAAFADNGAAVPDGRQALQDGESALSGGEQGLQGNGSSLSGGEPAPQVGGLAPQGASAANGRKSIFCGIGSYAGSVGSFAESLDHELMEAIGQARSTCKRTKASGGVIFPLCSERARSLGVLYVGSDALAASGASADDSLQLLEIYAHQAASSVNNAFLHSLVNTKNEELHETYAQLKERYMETVEVLRLAVDAKDEYTRGHSDRVSALSVRIGRALGFDDDSLERLRVAGLFHDVGKIGTADDILLKNSSLTDEEYDEIKRHPVKGAMILSAVSMFESIVPAVRHHHERYDGTGYPDGIAGEAIELDARILAVADALDAMTSDRQYRSHLSFDDALAQLREGAGTQFDPKIVACVLNLAETDPLSLGIEIR